MCAKAKELNAINHMLMEDIAEETLGTYAEYGNQEFMPLARKPHETEIATMSTATSTSTTISTTTTTTTTTSISHSDAIAHNDDIYTSTSTQEEIEVPFNTEDSVRSVSGKRTRRSSAEMELVRAKRSTMRELKRVDDKKLKTKIQLSKQSNVFPFTSTSAATRSPDQFYHSDDEMISVSADKLRG